MNEEKARRILSEMCTIQPDDSLYDGNFVWLQWYHTFNDISLDGNFTPEQLLALAWWTQNKKREEVAA